MTFSLLTNIRYLIIRLPNASLLIARPPWSTLIIDDLISDLVILVACVALTIPVTILSPLLGCPTVYSSTAASNMFK